MESEIKTSNQIISSLTWKFLERIGAQSVQLIVSIVLARLLSPNDYGVIAIVTVFINIFNVVIDGGFGSALIQKKEFDNRDFSTVFYFNIIVSLILYLLLFLIAPIIARFYNNDMLVILLRVLGLTLFVSGVKNIQESYVAKKMIFKKFFFSTIIGTVISAIIGIGMAFKGYGVWALVAQQLTNIIINTIVLWITVKWRPQIYFSFIRLKRLFSYGIKIFFAVVIDTIYNNIYDLIIGKKYSAADLAYYNKGKQFPNLIIVNINNSIQSVMFPVLSKEQDDISRIKEMIRKTIKMGAFIIFPIMVGMIAVANNFIKVLLTEKWLNAVPFLQILCISYMFYPIQTANQQVIKALGKSSLFLKLEIIRKIFGIIILVVTIPLGLVYMALGQVLVTIFFTLLNGCVNRRILKYKYKEQILDVLPSLIISIIMGLVVYCIGKLEFTNIILLILQVLIGGIIYIILAYVFKLDSYSYLLNVLKGIVNRKISK